MILQHFFNSWLLDRCSTFIWDSEKKRLNKVKQFNAIDIDLLIGIDRQKETLLENTERFAKGNYTNNVLLWGARGNGKSTLIKSSFKILSKKYRYLKLIQINKDNINQLDKIYNNLSIYKNYRFIIFIDDLSFEKIDIDYKIIKSSLDGSILEQPRNSLLYITSNRRHLMPRDMIENERSSAIHTDESVEEKISLSDRFGLWIGFHNISQNDFVNIIFKYCEKFKLPFNEKTEKEAIKWSLQRGNRTGRSAWQFIINYAAENNKKIDF